METAEIAKVVVGAAPYSIDKPYSYLVPREFQDQALVGVRVLVPFGRGNRESEGMILTRETGEKLPGLKPIQAVLDRQPVLSEQDLSLALWMRQRYFCTLLEAIKTILPAGLWYHYQEIWRVEKGLDESAAREKSRRIKGAEEVLEALFAAGGSADAEHLRSRCGDSVSSVLRALRKAGILTCRTTAKRTVRDKKRRTVELAVSAEDALAVAEGKRRSAPKQYEAIRFLSTSGRIAAADLCYFSGASMETLRTLEKHGLIRFGQEEQLRLPDHKTVEPGLPIVLNEEQQAAFDSVLELTKTNRPEAVLLEGVTGSGKTQIYIRLVQEILKQGRTAMVLVPEIVLTPQMMEKFSAYFGEKVAMLHSGLRLTSRYDQWKRIRRGDVQVVLGTRSAIFAPLPALGLIVLDEEQESSYQSENAPRYHTRDIAKYLCAREHATLVLGSATPAVESAWAAENGQYHCAVLRKRYNEAALPDVLIADMRQEIRAGNAGSIGTLLKTELEKNIQRGEQSILLLNRRGNSRMLLCGECGYVPECPRCSVPMTYHSANGRLMCHYCGHSELAPESCPACGGIMKHIGIGTQKAEEELHTLFPDVGILRLDADTAAATGVEPLLHQFETERIPILLGTQMVAKGLDFENVTLVGVLSADLSLYVDHYRAAERTFSLLTQVIGRAGRGEKRGRAVIQTYNPENDVIQCAARQDYACFYRGEIRMRKLRRYPPFADLFTFTISGIEEGAVLRSAACVRDRLRALCARPDFASTEPEILGPAPAPVYKLNNRFRYRVLLVGKNNTVTRGYVSWILKTFGKDRANRGLNIFVDCNTLE